MLNKLNAKRVGYRLTYIFLVNLMGLWLMMSWFPAEAAPEAQLTVSGGTVGEGSLANANLSFLITRTHNADRITVTATTQNGTAIGGDDYEAITETVVFTPGGSLEAAVNVTISADVSVELDETFSLILSDPISATLAVSEAIGIIENDDTATVSISGPATIVEGNAGSSLLTFMAGLNNDVPGGFDLSYFTTAGSATAGIDYLVPSGTISFTGTVGEQQPIQVEIVGDSEIEPDETFSITLGTFSNSIFTSSLIATPDAITGTIENDDSGSLSLVVGSVNEAAGALPYTVTLSAVASRPITVFVSTSDGTAQVGDNDYQPLVGEAITIPVGSLTGTGQITLFNDTKVEAAETLSLSIDSVMTDGLPITVGSPTTVSATILNDDSATVTLADSAGPEGDSGTSEIVFVATLDNAVDGGFDLAFSTSDDTAEAGQDYTADAGTLSFAGEAGETELVTITISGDADVEPNETFSVTMGAFSNSSLIGNLSRANNPATGTIQNDDSIQVDIDAGMVAEDSGSIPFTVTLVSPVLQPVTVTVSSDDGTATAADSDYQPIVGRELVIPAGETVVTSTLGITSDLKVEADETVMLQVDLFSTNGNMITTNLPAPVAATIENDDSATLTLTAPNAPTFEGNSGLTPFIFTVELDNPVDGGFQVAYETEAGTADIDIDFVDNDGSLTFAGTAGEEQIITVNVRGDLFVEPIETFTVQLGAITGTAFISQITPAPDPVVGSIVDDDSAGVFISNGQVTEGNNGQRELVLSVTLSSEIVGGFTVDYATADGTASSAQRDYQPISGTLAFDGNAFETQQITVTVAGDEIVEADETILINLSNVSVGGVEVFTTQGVGTIKNDDTASLSLSQAVTVTEGNSGQQMVPFTVSLDKPVQGGFRVLWSSADGSALKIDLDYDGAASQLVFNGDAGESQQFNLLVNGDSKVELDESFSVSLQSVAGLIGIDPNMIELPDSSRLVTILNDDVATVSLQGEGRPEGTTDGSTVFVVTATLSAATDVFVTVDLSVVGDTAILGDDFSTTDGAVTFAGEAGETKTFEILVFADGEVEPNETFNVVAGIIDANGRNVILDSSGSTATLTILDDDLKQIYLPQLFNGWRHVDGPDLVVSDIEVGSSTITVTIKNRGNEPVTKPFWVDSYINPKIPPTAVNQTIIEAQSEGFVWGIDLDTTVQAARLPMLPGDELVLTVGGLFYRPQNSNFSSSSIPAGAEIYVQVDSFNPNTTFGQVEENHEIAGFAYNNIRKITAPE